MESINGEKFINSVFPDLHYSKEVMRTAGKSDDPIEKIKKYFLRIEEVNNRLITDSSKIRIAKSFFYNKYLTSELPERYFEIQKKIEKKDNFTEEEKKERLESVRNTQKESFDKWFDYLVTSDYPTWFKYFILRGVLKSGVYDKSINKVTRRTKSTVEPFLDFNENIILNIYNYIIEHYGEEAKLFDELNAFNFQKLYIYFIERANDKSNDGIWVKYDQHSDTSTLTSSIQGKNTGWCTVLTDFAFNHLKNGDFYIYFTKDRYDNFSIPRLAIRLDGSDKVQEIRGIGEHQNIERDLFKIVIKKVKEFKNSEEFEKIIKNYRMLNIIESKTNNNEELTLDELCCLYEIGDTLDGFGFSKEKRIGKLRKQRNIKEDLNKIFREVDCSNKSLYLSYLEDVSGIIFPDSFLDLDLSGLKSLEHLVLSDKIKGNIILDGLEEICDYRFPSEIDGSLEFDKAKRISNVIFPERIKNNFLLKEVTSFSNTVFPKEIGGMFSFSKIEELENFIFPHCEIISARDIKRLKNVVFQDEIEGSIYLSSLKEMENVIVPRVVKGQMDLSGLKTVKSDSFPSDYVGCLDIKQLEDFSNLVLPQKVDRLYILKANMTDIVEKIESCNISELFVEKYYSREAIEKAIEDYRAKKLLLKEE